MKKLKNIALVLLVAVAFLFVGINDLDARGRSGGGSRSFSRSTSRSTPSRSTRSAKPKKSTTKSTKPKTSKRVTTAPKRTAAQQKSFETAKKNGTAFKSKSAATAAYKSKNAAKYTSKYAKQPATRPSHVPQTTMVGGSSVNINYNVGRGGYGYTNSLGAFIMYDMMSDAIMMNRMMARDNYHYDTHHAPTTRVIVHRKSNTGVLLFWSLVVIGVVVVICVVANKNKTNDQS